MQSESWWGIFHKELNIVEEKQATIWLIVLQRNLDSSTQIILCWMTLMVQVYCTLDAAIFVENINGWAGGKGL